MDDLVEGILRMMAGRDEFMGPVNLGNPAEFSIQQLADLILEMIPEIPILFIKTCQRTIRCRESLISHWRKRSLADGSRVSHCGKGWCLRLHILRGV